MNGNMVSEAVGLFAVTNIDDLLLLSLFFGRSAEQPSAAGRIVAGQYLSFIAILAITIAAAYGVTFLPESAIAYLGLLPLALGLRSAWQAWKDHRRPSGHERRDDTQDGPKTLRVAAITFANGGDNIGVYLPVFAEAKITGIAGYTVIFLVLVGVLCAVGRFIATRAAAAKVIDHWGHLLHPIVLVAIGLFILVSGGAFGL
ncbi:MAG: cadmium resistance transporter [Trebonia sp.]